MTDDKAPQILTDLVSGLRDAGEVDGQVNNIYGGYGNEESDESDREIDELMIPMMSGFLDGKMTSMILTSKYLSICFDKSKSVSIDLWMKQYILALDQWIKQYILALGVSQSSNTSTNNVLWRP